ncbi:unnamed protein product [Soboliphyme baturini]|uniref:Uncharacterized protein n=1 Tax=Soboliphyme baturini TaxID=241478 RepID=A0A3P8HBM8_9BILA|nr:unnamed protein product [Soboliphyme baturini]
MNWCFSLFSDVKLCLHSKFIKCRSVYLAEHIASVFSIAILFSLCNPYKTNAKKHGSSIDYCPQYMQWPLILAAGYGNECPSNKYLASTTSERDVELESQWDAAAVAASTMIAQPYLFMDTSFLFAADGGGSMCGGCGACGGCGGCGGCGS